eukprot:403337887
MYYLKAKIFEQLSELQKNKGNQYVDIDKEIYLEHQFELYIKHIQETTSTVQRFWSSMIQKEYEIAETIGIGQKIVSQYLQLSEIFEVLININPEFKELVQIQLCFYYDVMNFELEGQTLQNQLRNIQQKLVITNHSTYADKKQKQGLMIISGNPETQGKIIHINELATIKLQMKKQKIIGQNLNFLMPKLIADYHDSKIARYIKFSNENCLEFELPRVWFKKRNQCLVPCMIEIQTRISQIHGLVMIGVLNFNELLQTASRSCKLSEAYIMLSDELGFVQNVSQNFIQRFIPSGQFAVEDMRLNVSDIITIPEKQVTEVIQYDGEAFFLENMDLKSLNSVEQNTRSISLTIREFKMQKSAKFYEYAFIENIQQKFTDKVLSNITIEHTTQQKISDQYYLEDLNQLDLDINPSSQSGSSNQQDQANVKAAIDLKHTPQTLVNLKKAILIFFCILVGTSFSVLGVNQIQYKQFQDDSAIVKSSIILGGILANLRLVLRTLLLYPRSTLVSDKFSYDFLQGQLEKYHTQLQECVYQTLQDKNYQDQELIDSIQSNSILISELQQDGSITKEYKKYQLSLLQLLTKVQNFITIDQQSFQLEIKNFKIRTLPSKPTQIQRDAYYIIINGMYDIRSFSLQLYQLFLKQSQSKENVHDQTVLIITMTCIAITIVSSILLIPVTFALDQEQMSIAETWMKVSLQGKQEILLRIQDFSLQMEQQTSSKQSKIKSNDLSINYKHRIKSELEIYDSPQKDNKLSQVFSDFQSNAIDQSVLNFSDIGLMIQTQIVNMHQNTSLLNETRNKIGIQTTDKVLLFKQQETISTEEIQIQIPKLIDEEEKLQKQLNQIQLTKIYRKLKLKKALVILAFTLIIVVFYIGFYVMSQQIFNSAKDSFTYLTNINRRAPCLSNVYQFLSETYTQNKTLYVGYANETTMNHAQNTCMVYEAKMQEYQQKLPQQLNSLEKFFGEINSERLCQISFESDIEEQRECELFKNGILKKGLSNTIKQLFYQLFQELVEFDSYDDKQWLRTESFLNQHSYAEGTLDNIKLILRFILPASDIMNQKLDQALKDEINSQNQVFIIVFILFIAFLLSSLYISLGKLINFLKTDILRSRILIKIIPADQLKEIRKFESKTRKERDH